MENKDFCVFILTHGRPDNVKTFTTLKKCGYTGKIYFVIDNEDKTLNKYIENFGAENIKIFDKKEMIGSIDRGDNKNSMNIVVFARNACFDIAKKLSIVYFIVLDDDYTAFDFRIDTNSLENRGDIKPIKNIDLVFDNVMSYYKNNKFLSIAFAQGGDFIGGINNGKGSYRFNKRKCMNSFFCSTERPFDFMGAINEDVNAYVVHGSRGGLFLTIPLLSLTQSATQKNSGGLTDIYILSGTYVKSFYSVMMHPSGVKVSMMNAKNTRLHHSIKWNNTVPLILSEKYKKK